MIEKKIAHLIEKDFPAYYREEGPVFVQFLMAYYEWMESQGQTNYHARNLLDYKDIDTTVNDFIVYFKQKYLPNVQFDTATDVRQLIKHTLDLYRSKGTDRAIDLFFRLVYGKPAEIYYPGEDIFRLSDGKWIKPTYLEVTSSADNRKYINKQIVGLTSGATAFVERIIRRKISSKYAEIMFISSVNGNFQTGEKITIDGDFQEINPTVLGSLTTLQVIAGGENFAVGDIVLLASPNGVQGKARVSSVTDYTGLVDFIIVDGGWGYTANAEVLVSEKVLTISEITPSNTATTPFPDFIRITQPRANITYSAANGSFVENELLYSYYSNGALAGTARVLSAANSSATNGTIRVSTTNGQFGLVSEKNVNSTATVVTSKFSSAIAGVKHNATITGTVNISTGHRNITGAGTKFDNELFRPTANLTGTVSINATSNSVVGSGTLFDMELFTPSSNLVGNVYVNATSNAVLGIGTLFNDVIPGQYVSVYSNATHYQSRQVNSVTNSTVLYVKSPFAFDNAATKMAVSDLSPHISVYGNSSTYYSRTISTVTNATLLTVKNRFAVVNSTANYANAYMAEWVSFSNGSYREVRSVNNVVNAISMWLKWPVEFTNSAATVGNVTPSNTKFYVPFANSTETASFSAGNLVVTGTNSAFTGFVNGDFIALYANSSTYEIKTISNVANSTRLLLTNVASFTNSSATFANVTANDSFYYGKAIILFANSSTSQSFTVSSAANDSYLYLQSKPTFDNSALVFANSKIGSLFYKAGNTVVANATVYTDQTATANVIGYKANVQLTVTNNSLRIANDTIVYQTNSTGFDFATARVISVSYFGTNTYLVVNTVAGSFQPNSTINSKFSNGLTTSSNGVLSGIQYSVGVIDIENVFTSNTGNFVYTSSNTTGTVTRVSQQNIQAGFSISSNSLGYDETITFYGDYIYDYQDVYLGAETFQPPGGNLTANMAYSNVDTSLIDAFTNSAITIGSINNIIAINPGTDYDTAPVVKIYEPKTGPAGKRDYILSVSNSAGAFTVGEILVQNSATVGMVKSANTTTIYVKRIRYETPFDTSLAIEGLASGATANVDLIATDPNSFPIGMNSIIEANVVAASGSVTGLDVVDSGVGYVHNETVAFISQDGERSGQAVVALEKQGQSEGYYASKGSFLSADKKIFDGNYYQEYSYEIRSPITLDKYESMLRNVLHIAGTKFYASVVTPTVENLSVNLLESNNGISGRVRGNLSLGNSVVLVSNTKTVRVGDLVSGTGINPNTRITSINSTSFVMSSAASSTQSNSNVTYTR